MLADKEHAFRSPIETCSDITVLIDASGVVTYASPAITAALGNRPEEIVGSYLRDLVHPEDAGTLERMLAKLGRAPGASLSSAYRLRRRNGSWRRFEGSCANLLAVPGVGAIVCTFRDHAARKFVPSSSWEDTDVSEHFVQFYETDGFLVQSVADFIGSGLAAGEACIVVATPAHRDSIEHRLRAAGLDIDDGLSRGSYIGLDAAETLAQFMIAGAPEAARFAEVLGGVVAQAADGGRRVRIFGEMVALLWAEGNADAAIRVEELWNDLRDAPHTFSLFCAYPMGGFAREEHGAQLMEICGRHARVIPDESYSALASVDERLRAITLLKQKAQSLDAEITERAAAQESLRISENRYRRLFEASTDGILIVDPRLGVINDANPVMVALLGYSREELLGQALWDVGVFPEREAANAVMRDLDQRKVVRYETLPLRARDGQLRQVEFVGNRFHLDGHVVIQCNLRDVTERRRLERRTSEALDALLAMAEALVSVDTSSKDDAANVPEGDDDAARIRMQVVAQRLAELTRQVLGCERVSLTVVEPATGCTQSLAAVGLPPELERTWWDAILALHAEDALDDPCAGRLRAGEAVVVGLAQRQGPDRSTSYAERALVVPLLLRGELVGTLSAGYGSVLHTYTPDETALAMAVGKLVTLVVERERLLREREDARASALALQEANRRMDEFLGIASHELKTPVTAIKMNLQIMARRAGELQFSIKRPEYAAEVERVVERIGQGVAHGERGVNRLMRIVDDLLDVSRIRAGKLEIYAEACDLASIVREAVEEQRQLHPQRTVRLEKPQRDGVPIWADADRVGQVVNNYLTNALKYSGEDRPVDVEVWVCDGLARVCVRDCGPGLTPEEQVHIWEPFHRVPRVTVESGSGIGLGLGLHICKTVIEQQGGSVGVESTVGEGSTFWFTLPMDVRPGGKSQAFSRD